MAQQAVEGAARAQWASVFREDLFEGQAGLVTGGGTGIGFAIAFELLTLGADVLITSRNEDRLAEAAATLRKAFPERKVEYFVCNIRDDKEVAAMITNVLERFGRLNFVVNCAGGQYPAPASAITNNGFRTVVDLNLNGTFAVCREAFDQYMFDHGGNIVNIIATYHNGFPMMAHTGAARAAVANLTETLALEWAAYGVRVNSVAPGNIYSESSKLHYRTKGNFLGDDPIAAAAPFIPCKRIGSTQEVSGLVCFLLSPAASYVTGVTARIDGGATLMSNASYVLCDVDNYPKYGELPPEEDTRAVFEAAAQAKLLESKL
ncbi:Peroxisomal trans-2-enoyl-CoA reductase [Hondaea fermentalgiana]|uniref:Peroxisomal trans-2-enoyl-CoA reductase n=1 Tax=Hondaea fermentalgiana TaxID=2315210 RepID=A0A2R5GC04_9STRA|nr:Peroxisomal trans-2-enoyl-CoA reductase [Hondaea fermentalgiana]|eukprot:GBG28085.1 Peroxisomal trans-2-enoyl-CoA reductase [Hondaea fermentalgiana]